MNFSFLEMLYSIPELQTLSYQLYQQMPDRTVREEERDQVWQACMACPDPAFRELIGRLEDAENYVGALRERAAFFTGMYLAWGLNRSMSAVSGDPAPSPHR